MTAIRPQRRPNCEEILKRKKKWALNEREFEINKELKKIIHSKESENELTIYSLLRSKLNSDKAIKLKSISISNEIIDNIKTFEKSIGFKDSFVKNDFYSKNFEVKKTLGFGSFGSVFKVKRREGNDCNRTSGREYSAIKRIEITSVVKNEINREYLNDIIIKKDYSKNEYLVEHFDTWFEESVVPNQSRISLFIEMELCDKTLEDVTKEFDKESHLKTNGTLTTVGYYIASNIFLQILEGVNYLHEQNPPIIHRNLKPANIWALCQNCRLWICVY
jgi:hypothetical protein